MSLNISLEQFNAIAKGKYNAGQIDYVEGRRGPKLVKVNNHVYKTRSNDVTIDKERVLQIKNAFLDSIAGKVSSTERRDIARLLGIADIDLKLSDPNQVQEMMQRRYEPLQRQQVRDIIDRYDLLGTVATRKSKPVSQSIIEKREAVNSALMARTVATDDNLSDLLEVLSFKTSIDKVLTQRKDRLGGDDAGYGMERCKNDFAKQISSLFKAAVSLLPDNAPPSVHANLFGQDVEVMLNRNTGAFSVKIGEGNLAFTANLEDSIQNVITYLKTGIVLNRGEVFNAEMIGNLLDIHYSADIMNGLLASDRTSSTRQFAAEIIASKMEGVNYEAIMSAPINTNFLIMLAKEVLEGAIPNLNLEALQARHEALKVELGGLDNETLEMLALVSKIPLERNDNGSVNLTVTSDDVAPQEGLHKPMPQDIKQVANKELPDELIQHLKAGKDVSKPADVRDFVADMMFSDDTLMSEVNLDMPGEHFRSFLMSARNMDAFRDIMVNRGVLDTAVAPTLAGAAKTCFEEMFKLIDAAYQAKYGKSIASENATSEQFKLNFANLVNGMEASVLARCENLILQFANNGTEQIQAFINNVFQLNQPEAKDGQPGVKQSGEQTVTRPYEGKSIQEVKEIVRNSSLNDLIDNSSRDTVPGQIGLFKQALGNYFKGMTMNDKRSMLAASLRFADTYDFTDVEPAKQEGVKQAKTAQFCGAILKGTGPILQKMMQGLPRTMLGGFADALEDMKCNLPPINRKIVQGHFAKIIQNNPDIKSITLKKSLGAATVGEALLCEITYKDGEELKTKDVVFKIMRHDAVERTKREAKIFNAAARDLGPGMVKTWEGQYQKILEELDFRNEARNIEQGQVYDKKVNEFGAKASHATYSQVRNPCAMKLFGKIATQRNVMALEVAPGQTANGKIKQSRQETQNIFKNVCETDGAGNIRWNKGVPVFKKDANIHEYLHAVAEGAKHNFFIQIGQQAIMAAAETWFEEAIVGNGFYHGDMHAGNIMIGYEGDVTFIDFGNVTKLNNESEKGVNERKSLLKMIFGATIRMPSLFLAGFKELLSEAGRAEYAKNEPMIEAIIEEVMKKGQFSYDMCYRLQAAVNELQKLELEMPPQINGFIQSMTRLQNTLAEANTVALQNQILLKNITEGKLPRPEQPQKTHEFDIFGELVDNFFNPEMHKQIKSKQGTDTTTFAQELDKWKNVKIQNAYKQNVIAHLDKARSVEELRNSMNELIDHCAAKHVRAAEKYTNKIPGIILNDLHKLVAQLDNDSPDLTKIKKDFVDKLYSLFNVLRPLFLNALTSVSHLQAQNAGTFANVLTNILFDSGDTADEIMGQLAAEKISVGWHIIRSGITNELNFSGSIARPNEFYDNFTEAVKKNLQLGSSDSSYQLPIDI